MDKGRDTLDNPLGNRAVHSKAVGNTAGSTPGSTAGNKAIEEDKGSTEVEADTSFSSLELCPTLSTVHFQIVQPACTSTLVSLSAFLQVIIPAALNLKSIL